MPRHGLRRQRGIKATWRRLSYRSQITLLMVWWFAGTALVIWGLGEYFAPADGVSTLGVVLMLVGSTALATWFVFTGMWQHRQNWAVVCDRPHVGE